MTADFEEIRQSVRRKWKTHSSLLGFVIWRPFRDERQFNYCLQVAMSEIEINHEQIDWEGGFSEPQYEDRNEESEVLTAIIDMVIRKCMPDINPDNFVVRAAIRFEVYLLLKELHNQRRDDDDDESRDWVNSFGAKVNKWSSQANNLPL